MTASGYRWPDDVNASDVLAVAVALDLTVDERTRSFGPCPAGGGDRRTTKRENRADKRGPCGVRNDRRGWGCHRCGARGDAVALVALVATGQAKPAEWAPVRALAASVGLCEADTRDGAPPVVRAPRVEVPRVPPAPAEWTPPERDPARLDELRALWDRCRPLVIDDDARRWFLARGLGDGLRVGRLGMARALPSDGLPAWALPWRSRRRIVVPMFAHTGELVELRGRWHGVEAVEGGGWRATKPDDGREKTLNASGARIGGAYLADTVGRWLLARGRDARPGDEVAPGVTWDGRVRLAEGEPDAWTLAIADTRFDPATGGTFAVLGYVNGSGGDGLAARLPACSRVVAFAHVDPHGQGREMADRILAPLRGRVAVAEVADLSAVENA